jgi:hypothetical protein
MSGMKIDCPHCHQPFELTDALARPLLDAERERARAEGRQAFEAERMSITAQVRREAEEEHAIQLRDRDAAIAARDVKLVAAQQAELDARKAREAAEQAKREVQLDVQRQVDAMRETVTAEVTTKADAEVAVKLRAAEIRLAEKDAKLVVAQAAEVEARQLKTEAEESKRETELLVSRRLEEESAKVREKAVRERDEEHRLKVADKDAQLRAMQDQIEELRRKGETASQQLVGEVQEVDLLATLQEAFPMDRFERVKKGHRGADVLQTVLSSGGTECGKILWESKRTKSWSEPWLAKLREDQRDAKADIAALATETLPEGVACFEQRDGIWVLPFNALIPVACALRHLLIEVTGVRRTGAFADSTKDQVFTYLISPQFRQRVSRIVEGYQEMRADLDKEKRATTTSWSKREKQLDRILGGMTGFYGDLQGLVGASLPGIEGLMLSGPDEAATKPRLTVVNSDVNTMEGVEANPLLS